MGNDGARALQTDGPALAGSDVAPKQPVSPDALKRGGAVGIDSALAQPSSTRDAAAMFIADLFGPTLPHVMDHVEFLGRLDKATARCAGSAKSVMEQAKKKLLSKLKPGVSATFTVREVSVTPLDGAAPGRFSLHFAGHVVGKVLGFTAQEADKTEDGTLDIDPVSLRVAAIDLPFLRNSPAGAAVEKQPST